MAKYNPLDPMNSGTGWFEEASSGDVVFMVASVEKLRISKAAGAVTLAAAATPAGGVAAAGGFAAYATACHTGGAAVMASTDGNDSTPIVTEIYISEIFVPCNMSITGIAALNGSVASDDWHRALLDKDGALVAGTATGAVTSSGADAYQKVPFTGGPVTVLGPATYYVAQICDGVVDRYNTHAIGAFIAGKITGQTYGAIPAANTLPVGFTTALGPIASLY